MHIPIGLLLLIAIASLVTSRDFKLSSSIKGPTIRDLQLLASQSAGPLHPQTQAESQAPIFQEHHLSVPVDHFHNDSRYSPHSNETFNLRYWFNAEHYKPNGPIILIAAGESSGIERFPFLHQGIVAELSRTYHGIGVILEHRYYGTSFPVSKTNVTTPNAFRFLTTDQAIADTAYFANHVVFPGLEDVNLTAAAGNAAWIAYGGSYAGAFVAILRKLYPETFWGAVSTSGVTQAIVDYWEYYEAIRIFGPRDCVWTIQTFTGIVDEILINRKENRTLVGQLKDVFGLASIRDDQDFASSLSYTLGDFQGRNWDRDVSSTAFGMLCSNITSSDVLYNDTGNDNRRSAVAEVISAGGQDGSNSTLVTRMLNWIGFLNSSMIYATVSSADEIEAAFSTPHGNPSLFSSLILNTSSSTTTNNKDQNNNDNPLQPIPGFWLYSWLYQVCTQWGYFINGFSAPSSIMPLISRTLDLTYSSSFCPGLFNITSPPKVDEINKHGGWNFSFPRVAIIDGVADPWRAATPHVIGAGERESTDSEPWLLIDVPEDEVWDGMRGGVHHWDQNGVFWEGSGSDERSGKRRPPGPVEDVQREVVRFVGVWLRWWKEEKERNESKLKGNNDVFWDEPIVEEL